MSLSQIGVINSFQNVEKACFRLPFRGNYLGSAITVGQGWNPCRLGGLELSDCRFQFISKTCLSIGGSHAWKTLRRSFNSDNSKGESKSPFKGESFRPFFSPTQERACPSRHERQSKNNIQLNWWMKCTLHSLQPLRLFATQKSTRWRRRSPLSLRDISPHCGESPL